MASKDLPIPVERIEKAILLIRREKVLLDKDLALLYGVSISVLNKPVTRNIERFPEDFMFQPTREEFNNLKFHFGTSSWGGTRKLPSAFTEQGVAMLSSVLNSKRACDGNLSYGVLIFAAPDDIAGGNREGQMARMIKST